MPLWMENRFPDTSIGTPPGPAVHSNGIVIEALPDFRGQMFTVRADGQVPDIDKCRIPGFSLQSGRKGSLFEFMDLTRIGIHNLDGARRFCATVTQGEIGHVGHRSRPRLFHPIPCSSACPAGLPRPSCRLCRLYKGFHTYPKVFSQEIPSMATVHSPCPATSAARPPSDKNLRCHILS